MPDSMTDRDENTFWPWVVGLVLLALVVWVAAEVTGEPRHVAEPVVATVPVMASGADALQAWVRDSGQTLERTGAQPAYATSGMRRVVAALQAVVLEGDPALRERVSRLSAATSRIDSISAPAERVVALRTAFTEASHILQAHVGPAADDAVQRLLQQAQDAATSLDETITVEEQRHRVFQFFDHIAEAIRLTGPASGTS